MKYPYFFGSNEVGSNDFGPYEIDPNCHHQINNLSYDIENVINGNEINLEKTHRFVENQAKKIKANVQKLSLAPGEGGKWEN